MITLNCTEHALLMRATSWILIPDLTLKRVCFILSIIRFFKYMYDSPGLFLIPSSLLYWMDTKYSLDINGVERLSLVAFQNNLNEKNKYRPKKGALFKTKLKSYIFNIINNTLGGYYSNLSNSTYPSHIIHSVWCTFPVWYRFLNIFLSCIIQHDLLLKIKCIRLDKCVYFSFLLCRSNREII